VQPARSRYDPFAMSPDAARNDTTDAADHADWTLSDERDMGEGVEQGEIIRLLLACLDTHAAEQGWVDRYWAGDQFFAWRPGAPLVRVSPDVYVVDDPPPPPRPASWQTWLPGHRPPRFALEVVSEDWQKDYAISPQKYEALGCGELVVFDPEAWLGTTTAIQRVPLQHYDRTAGWSRVTAGASPIWCPSIAASIVPVRIGACARLRLGRDVGGTDLIPTAAEQVVALRARVAELERR
jgi:hypothetical protein